MKKKLVSVLVALMLFSAIGFGVVHNAPTAHAGFPCQSNVGWVTVADSGYINEPGYTFLVRSQLQAWEDLTSGTFCGPFRGVGTWVSGSSISQTVRGSMIVADGGPGADINDGTFTGILPNNGTIIHDFNQVTPSDQCSLYSEFFYTSTGYTGQSDTAGPDC